jgi:hypothetical protein
VISCLQCFFCVSCLIIVGVTNNKSSLLLDVCSHYVVKIILDKRVERDAADIIIKMAVYFRNELLYLDVLINICLKTEGPNETIKFFLIEEQFTLKIIFQSAHLENLRFYGPH